MSPTNNNNEINEDPKVTSPPTGSTPSPTGSLLSHYLGKQPGRRRLAKSSGITGPRRQQRNLKRVLPGVFAKTKGSSRICVWAGAPREALRKNSVEQIQEGR